MNEQAIPSEVISKRSSGALVSFVLGLLSVLLCLNVLAGLPAIILGILALSSIKKDQLSGRGLAIAGIVLGGVGTLLMPILLAAMLFPALNAVLDSSRDTKAKHNLKQIGLAAFTYEHSKGSYPATAGGEAPNQVSWRVELSPFMEAAHVADQYQRDQPWNSPQNISLLPNIPEPLRDIQPSSPMSGNTNILAVTGERTLLQTNKKSSSSQALDGAANTIMFVEVNDELAVPWTKPEDYEFDPQDPRRGLGQKRRGHFNASFADGRVQSINNDIDPNVLRAMMTANGKEVLIGDDTNVPPHEVGN